MVGRALYTAVVIKIYRCLVFEDLSHRIAIDYEVRCFWRVVGVVITLVEGIRPKLLSAQRVLEAERNRESKRRRRMEQGRFNHIYRFSRKSLQNFPKIG